MTTTTTTTVSTTTTTDIKFRSKFVKVLTDENRQTVEAAFGMFFKFNPEDAKAFLWRMTYLDDKEEVLQKINLTGEDVSGEIIALRNELRFQYVSKHGELYPTIDFSTEEIKVAYQAVEGKDFFMARQVYARCKLALWNGELDLEKNCSRLLSPKENIFYGGIRWLGFSYYESDYLKEFHMEIYGLFKAMVEFKKASNSAHSSGVKDLDKKLKEAGVELPFEMKEDPAKEYHEAREKLAEITSNLEEGHSDEQSESKNSEEVTVPFEFTPLTPAEIITHKEVFSSLVDNFTLDVMSEISKLGFDLNQVMAKQEKIANFIKAFDAFAE